VEIIVTEGAGYIGTHDVWSNCLPRGANTPVVRSIISSIAAPGPSCLTGFRRLTQNQRNASYEADVRDTARNQTEDP